MFGYYPYIFIGLFLLIAGIYEVFFTNNLYTINRERSNRVLYLSLIFISIIFMTRCFVGWDWYNYYPDFFQDKFAYEKGYRFFVKSVRALYPNFNFFIGINTVIDFLLLGYILKKYSKYPVFTLLLYLTINGLSLEIDVMRNVKSILLFLVSIQFIESRNFIPYILLNIVGSSFHVSSLLYIPLYFILNLKIDKKLILGLFVAGVVYYLSNYNFIIEIVNKLNIERLNGYKTLFIEGGRGVNIFFLERVIFFFTVYIFQQFINEKDSVKYNIFANSAYIGIFIFLYTTELSIISLRLFLMFVYSYWFIFPIIIGSLQNRMELKILVFIVALSIGLFRSYNFLGFKGNKMVYGYDNIFIKSAPMEEKIKILEEARKYNDDGIKKELLLQY